MVGFSPVGGLQQTTSYRVVLPFYIYAAVSFLVACTIMALHPHIFFVHHFHPHTLSLTHLMALGWATMIILGASHQLLPVIIEGKLSSNLLGYFSFIFTGTGIPILAIGFYFFGTGWILQVAAVLINTGIICFLANVLGSIWESKRYHVHVWYMAASTLWLFSTTFFGLLLVFNFTQTLLPDNSVAYLSVHAHMGLVGWFLLLIIGVGSRLIPMFMISKYTQPGLLLAVFLLINAALVSYLLFFIFGIPETSYYLSLAFAATGIFLFSIYCYRAWRVRIRKKIDNQVRISLLSVGLIILPMVILPLVIYSVSSARNLSFSVLYGFFVFFGWITAIILGMTFKTLPFIVWNKTYHGKAHSTKTPAPKDLFREDLYRIMSYTYIAALALTTIGVVGAISWLVTIGGWLMWIVAVLYVLNVGIILFHQPKAS